MTGSEAALQITQEITKRIGALAAKLGVLAPEILEQFIFRLKVIAVAQLACIVMLWVCWFLICMPMIQEYHSLPERYSCQETPNSSYSMPKYDHIGKLMIIPLALAGILGIVSVGLAYLGVTNWLCSKASAIEQMIVLLR